MAGNWDWMAGGAPLRRPRDEGGYDVMQVCLNGHQITDSAEQFPDHTKPFCPECGERTITACPDCKAAIQGHLKGGLSSKSTPVQNNCHACGTAFPWRQQALAAAVEAVQLELDEKDAVAAEALITDISTENPRTELAAYKLKKMLSKLQKPAYDITIKVVSDIASATAKAHLGIK